MIPTTSNDKSWVMERVLQVVTRLLFPSVEGATESSKPTPRPTDMTNGIGWQEPCPPLYERDSLKSIDEKSKQARRIVDAMRLNDKRPPQPKN